MPKNKKLVIWMGIVFLVLAFGAVVFLDTASASPMIRCANWGDRGSCYITATPGYTPTPTATPAAYPYPIP